MTEAEQLSGVRPLEAQLWGEVRFSHAGVAVEPPSHKAAALLAYLVVAPAAVRREELAALLWSPDRLANVRQALYTLRSLPGADEWLDDGVKRVSVRAVSDVGRLREADGNDLAALVDGLGGTELLAGFGARLPSEYLEWLTRERASSADLVRSALAERAAQLEGQGEAKRALELTVRAQALDPYDEELQRSAMRLAYVSGAADVALASFAAFTERLAVDLGAEPSSETAELARRIERREPLGLRAALAALSDLDRRTLQALALARGALRVDGLASVLERPAFELVADLARLAERGLIDEHLGLSPEQRAAILPGLPAPLRRLLSERIVAVLRNDVTADQGALARHLLAAGERAEAASRALAGARAEVERSHVEAADELAYLTLWAAPSEPTLRLEAVLLLERNAASRMNLDAQADFLDEAERLAWELQSDAALAECNVRRTRFLLARGRVGEALEEALKALETALRITDDSLVARARNAVGAAHFYAGDLDGAAASFAASLAGADDVERYRAHNNLGSINAMRGRLDESYHHFDEALTLARRHSQHLDVSATLNNLAASAERFGDYARAERHFKEGITVARRANALRREAEMLINLAVVYGRQGQLGPAWNTTAEVEVLAHELADRRLSMRVSEQRSEIKRLCGDLPGAVDALNAALDLATSLGDERKRLALRAQLLAAEARLDPRVVPRLELAILDLEAARLTDVAPWLRLELALCTSDVAVAQAQLAVVDEGQLKSAHQRLVREVVCMRLALLLGADAAVKRAGLEARERLAHAGLIRASHAHTTGAPQVERAEVMIVEGPKARYLAWLLEPDAPPSWPPPPPPPAVVAELREQGAGLPRAMAVSLLELPAAWLDPQGWLGHGSGSLTPR